MTSLFVLALACGQILVPADADTDSKHADTDAKPVADTDAKVADTKPALLGATAVAPTCTNTCADYQPSWVSACPAGSRCLTFTNASTTESVFLAYQIGCDGDGTPGAPQCDCTNGPELAPGASSYFVIVDGDFTSCTPWTPACLTSGLAVLANTGAATCASGTRVEFTAGNSGDMYAKFDSWNLDVEKAFYSIPVAMAPDITCVIDHANHDCRPLFCGSATCPDAYSTPTTGGCPDGRSPQVGCQDTFGTTTGGKAAAGVSITYFPTSGAACQDAVACP